jgi:hypothetical protein
VAFSQLDSLDSGVDDYSQLRGPLHFEDRQRRFFLAFSCPIGPHISNLEFLICRILQCRVLLLCDANLGGCCAWGSGGDAFVCPGRACVRAAAHEVSDNGMASVGGDVAGDDWDGFGLGALLR